MSEQDNSRPDRTTYHVQRAKRGDHESLEWLVGRLSPLLLSTARYRLGPRFQRTVDPEDLVQEVWAVALPKLAGLPTRDGRETPVLLRYLSTTLMHLVNNLVRRSIRRGARAPAATSRGEALERLPQETRGILTRLIASERETSVRAAIEALSPQDRELVILRGIEQHPYRQISVLLGRDEKTLAVQYQRALGRLRRSLHGSVLDELPD